MINNTFLGQFSRVILDKHASNLSNTIIVLPNKRAKVFLLDAFKNSGNHVFFAPQIISIEDFIQNVSGIRSIDNIELLFEFYNVYLTVTPKTEQQNFETFSNWAKTLLQDFNEIDRYLLEPNHVFSYLKDIEAIKRWDLEPKDKTKLIDNYLKFWEQFPLYYKSLYKHLLSKGVGYQGLIYREAVNNLNHFSNNIESNYFVFGGFNALNQAEEKIFQYLLSLEKASVYWDVEETFLNDPYHDAGLFIRKIKNSWPYYKTNPFEWISNHYKEAKTISVIGTPKTIGQAKLVGSIIKDIAQNNSLQKVAIVLGEENILIPLLHSLPSEVTSLNITMGYSSKNNPAQILVNKIFKLHNAALSRSGNSYVFYYKDVLDVLNNPLIESFANTKELEQIIKHNNFTFITHSKLVSLSKDPNVLFDLLFTKWSDSIVEILERILQILIEIKQNLNNQSEEEKIAKAFVYSIYKVINKLLNYALNYPHITNPDHLYSIYKQIITLAEVSFEGEPLEGLQIMGVLESRVLDFETVIITSMNEGTFPAGKSQNSYIPYDVKRELGLPTFKEKDAIYTYHFYHLMQRAKNIYLLYNTETEGIDAGEKSRFITQIEVELQSTHTLTHDVYNSNIPEKAYTPIEIIKSELALNKLKEIAEKGFSPSSLTNYIRNPIQFYFQKVLKVYEVDEVEENVAVNTLGTIIHETLLALFKDSIGKHLSVQYIESVQKLVDAEVLNQFKLIYKDGEITKGKNLLAFEVAKRNINNFLKTEKALIEAGDLVEILYLEHAFDKVLVDKRLPYPVKISGNIDRIEIRNGKVRIIDYKTGKVEQASLNLSVWNGLTLDIKNDKIIQLLCYAFMFKEKMSNYEIEVGILSFKNLKTGFMPFQIKEGREVITNTISQDVLDSFLTEIIILINEILDQEIPFLEKIKKN